MSWQQREAEYEESVAKEDPPAVSKYFGTVRLWPVVILLEFTVIPRISSGIRIGARCHSPHQLI